VKNIVIWRLISQQTSTHCSESEPKSQKSTHYSLLTTNLTHHIQSMGERALRKLKYILYVIEAPDNLRKEIIANASKTLIGIFSEVILNIKEENLVGDQFVVRYKTEVRRIVKRSTSTKTKREYIAELGQGFFIDLREVLYKYV
jgi:hypothetical protein